MTSANLEQENTVALQLVQAMLGLIGDGVQSVCFSVHGETIELQFLVSPGFDMDIEDIVFELDVLTDGKYRIEHGVLLEHDVGDWPAPGFRMVYRHK